MVGAEPVSIIGVVVVLEAELVSVVVVTGVADVVHTVVAVGVKLIFWETGVRIL